MEIEPDPRFSYANERTFLTWIRTALGLITGGLVVTQLFPGFDVPCGRRMIGLPMIGLGVLIALFSYTHWQRNEVAMGAFRVELLRHIGMEEKVLFAAAREARGGEPLPIAERLRVDHGAIAALLVPTPTGALVAEILSVLGPHNRREEEPDGVYDACDRALGPAAAERLVEELRGFPEPPPKPYNDGPAVMSHIAANLELACRQWLEADTAS